MTASWRLYTQSDILQYRAAVGAQVRRLLERGLFVPTGHLAWDRQIVKGHEYEVALLLKKALFPLKAGKLTVTPLEAEATTLQTRVLSPAPRRRADRKALRSRSCRCPPRGGRPGSSRQRRAVRAVGVGRSHGGQGGRGGDAARDRQAAAATSATCKLPKLDKLEGFKVYEPTTEGDASSRRRDPRREGLHLSALAAARAAR